ncbi:hypothetical protein LWI29_026455 [Acer saccharum]|uniref:RNase H type-1 domain-containing protein n=1 Tax=Acer saccharum TaxID=4024 RepID=A0AA39VI65_ACESA|nr:hypothetical protein LWI29_026455 [Acer saccharum]
MATVRFYACLVLLLVLLSISWSDARRLKPDDKRDGRNLSRLIRLLGEDAKEFDDHLLALRDGLLLAKQHGLKDCWTEVDAVNVVAAVNDCKPANGVAGSVINVKALFVEVQIDVLKRNNPGTMFKSTGKGANCVAQWLAKYGLESVDNLFWMEDVPGGLRNLVEAERPV